MPGFMPGIHVFAATWKTWMAGTSPAMTKSSTLRPRVVAANTRPEHIKNVRQVRKIQQAQGAAAARARRPWPGRDRRHARHDRENPRGLRALRLRAGRNASDRIHRRARQIPARPGPAERRRILLSRRRRAMAVAALRFDGAPRTLRGREFRHAAKTVSFVSLRLGVSQREAGAGTVSAIHAVRCGYSRHGVARR